MGRPEGRSKGFSAFATAVIEPRSKVRPATVPIASYLRVQIMPAFGEMAVSKITRLSVQPWVPQTLGSRTGGMHIGSLPVLCVRQWQDLIRQSPCYSIVLPRLASPELRFLSPDQVEGLAAIDAAMSPSSIQAPISARVGVRSPV